MPLYLFSECGDVLIGHPGPVGDRFDCPCHGVRLRISSEDGNLPPNTERVGAAFLRTHYKFPMSAYQTSNLMHTRWVSRLGLEVEELGDPIEKEIVRSIDGKLVASIESFYLLDAHVSLCSRERITEGDDGVYRQESKPHKVVFLVSENLPLDYLCLGWSFVQEHFGVSDSDPVDWWFNHETQDRLYEFHAKSESFCKGSQNPHLEKILA